MALRPRVSPCRLPIGFAPQQAITSPLSCAGAALAAGPTHFCRNSSQGDGQATQPRPLGGTLLKRRLIEGQGWLVVSMNAAQWEALRGAAEKRQALKEAVLAATPTVQTAQ